VTKLLVDIVLSNIINSIKYSVLTIMMVDAGLLGRQLQGSLEPHLCLRGAAALEDASSSLPTGVTG